MIARLGIAVAWFIALALGLAVGPAAWMVSLESVASVEARPKKDRPQTERPTLSRTRGRVAGGTHWRIDSDNGPVHVWIPPRYERSTAGMVIYVHGYHIDVDRAWKRHKLAQQFRKSRQNAMFLVPEAPRSGADRVYWNSLAELKKTVRRAGMRLPDGPAIAVAHSGGFRTLSHWVDNRLLAQVILIDAMYGRQKAFDDFIDSGKRARHHKMVIVAANDTAEKSRKFAERFPYAAVLDQLPRSYETLSRREKRTKLLYIRSRYGHGALVTSGKVLPLVLRMTPLRRL
ncbi:MAG: hypothetical protein MJE77_27800 [Proteobacteria bacterium]|nr:hypothetical protein [Pseudomonadota bacterium]